MSETSNLRFLIVDDEQGQRAFLEHVLSMHFPEAVIDVSSDPIEALEKIRTAQHRYTLVLSDFTMPKMNGAELCRQAKSFRPGVPFIILSGVYTNETPSRESGADFVEKPYKFIDLITRVRSYLPSPQGS